MSTAGSMRAWIEKTTRSWLRSASTADCMPYCSFTASTRPRAASRCTWPSDAEAAADGSKLAKREAHRAELGRHAPLDERRYRRALASWKSSRVLLGQRLGDRREQLGDLHDRPFEPAESGGELGGVARARLPARTAAARPGARRPHPRWCRPARSVQPGRKNGSLRRPCRGALLASRISVPGASRWRLGTLPRAAGAPVSSPKRWEHGGERATSRSAGDGRALAERCARSSRAADRRARRHRDRVLGHHALRASASASRSWRIPAGAGGRVRRAVAGARHRQRRLHGGGTA